MMEMMLTLAVVSILLMLTVQSAPQNNAHTVDREVDNIAFFFQLAQTNALNTKQAHVVEFDRTKHRIVIKSGYERRLKHTHSIPAKYSRADFPDFYTNQTGIRMHLVPSGSTAWMRR